jgi:hypothetical protein
MNEEIPLKRQLDEMEITPDHDNCCLDHIKRLWKLTDDNPDCPYVVCMGYRCGDWLHCWLETMNLVVDLTCPRGERYFSQDAYYSRFEIQPLEVKRYTSQQSFKMFQRFGELRFWELDETLRYSEE